MKIRTPYTNLNPITHALLRTYPGWQGIPIEGEWGYTRFLQRVWDEHTTTIIVEHDIIFWPGALEELWTCSQEWCYYGYDISDVSYEHPFLGCTKIAPTLMDKALDCWERQPDKLDIRPGQPPWSYCDTWLWLSAGKTPGHRHFPSVVNSNRILYPTPEYARSL